MTRRPSPPPTFARSLLRSGVLLWYITGMLSSHVALLGHELYHRASEALGHHHHAHPHPHGAPGHDAGRGVSHRHSAVVDLLLGVHHARESQEDEGVSPERDRPYDHHVLTAAPPDVHEGATTTIGAQQALLVASHRLRPPTPPPRATFSS